MSTANPEGVAPLMAIAIAASDLEVGSGIKLKDRGAHKLKGVPESWDYTGALGLPIVAAEETRQRLSVSITLRV